MIESFLLEKNSYMKKAILSRPNVLLVKNLSITPVTIWTAIILGLLLFVWINGDIITKYIPLHKIHFNSPDCVIQIQVLLTTIAAVLLLAGIQWQKSVTVTITSDYISIEKGISKSRKNHIVMLSDISKMSFRTGVVGFLGRFGKLKIKRRDNSVVVIRSIPSCVSKVISQAINNYQNNQN